MLYYQLSSSAHHVATFQILYLGSSTFSTIGGGGAQDDLKANVASHNKLSLAFLWEFPFSFNLAAAFLLLLSSSSFLLFDGFFVVLSFGCDDDTDDALPFVSWLPVPPMSSSVSSSLCNSC